MSFIYPTRLDYHYKYSTISIPFIDNFNYTIRISIKDVYLIFGNVTILTPIDYFFMDLAKQNRAIKELLVCYL